MIAWILALWANPLARKITVYVAIALGVLYGLRLYGNRQWSKGEAQGRLTVTKDIEKQKQAEWKAKEMVIAADSAQLAAGKLAIKAAADQLAQDRATIARSLKDALAAQTATERSDYANAVSVPVDQLNTALRAISTDLASAH
jgi:hypothetical protein